MIPILMYHRINDVPHGRDPYYGMSMSPERFDLQMRYLAEHKYRVLTLENVLHYTRAREMPPEKSIALTFDDGYQDNYDFAWPILKKYGFTATIFLVAERIGKTNDWDASAGIPFDQLMPLDCVREMIKGGIDFGSHTLSHSALTRVSEEEAWRQIHVSRQVLMDQLEAPVNFFSYPYDLVNRQVHRLASQSGYNGACGTSSMPYDLFNMWRIEVLGHDSIATFRKKVAGFHYLLMWFRDRTALGNSLLRLKQKFKNFQM